MLKQTTYDSPLGQMTLLADDAGLYGVWFDGQAYFGGTFDLTTIASGDNAVLQAATAWMTAYFNGHEGQRPALHFSGTPYRQAVQQALCDIPRGQVATYQQLADRLEKFLGHKTAARAIGGAVGHNPLSVIVPCHRVVGSDGSMTGYAGGLWRKQALLELEGASDQVKL
ncbi:methylated-DNA--[protein]-cysteine S-methyltransferase [Lacticaseibacillus porcinae]|uniref:methylated-DNA--[protein]-cysteine S-methyltransferase n=1 Tax=Lacticaseibacillus porcinae TaxID=1123687 RepID=UPI000F7B133E|nr:methylated-DNA--[protein]-cysteine S-methyltransferase [Lacticaseibacillus porcinae]